MVLNLAKMVTSNPGVSQKLPSASRSALIVTGLEHTWPYRLAVRMPDSQSGTGSTPSRATKFEIVPALRAEGS